MSVSAGRSRGRCGRPHAVRRCRIAAQSPSVVDGPLPEAEHDPGVGLVVHVPLRGPDGLLPGLSLPRRPFIIKVLFNCSAELSIDPWGIRLTF